MSKKKKNPLIAVAQIRYYDTPAKHNVEKIKKYIGLAGKAGADIVCFPETCVHKTDFLPLNHKLITEIRTACQESKIWAVVTDTFDYKGTKYKTALLIDRQGKIRGHYKKNNLYDDSEAIPGNKTFVFQTDFAKVGFAICWDLAFPELFMKMKKQGAEIVFCPSYWCYEDDSHPTDHKNRELHLLKSLIQARAFENLFFMVYASPLSPRPDVISYSAVVAPHYTLKDISHKEGMIVQEVDLTEIKKFMNLYPNKK